MAGNPFDFGGAGGAGTNPFDFGGQGANAAASAAALMPAGKSTNPFDFAKQDAAAAAQKAAAAQPAPGGLAGILHEAGALITQAPSALGHMVTGAFTDPGGGALLGAGLGGLPGAIIGGAIGTIGYGLRGAVTGNWDLPESRQFIQGIVNTGSDIIHPQNFVQAYEQGHLVSKLAGDVGNIAMFAGGLGKALDVANNGTLQQASSAIETATAAQKAADEAAQALRDAGPKLGPAAQAGDLVADGQLQALGRRAADTAAEAAHWNQVRDATVAAAGPTLRAYRIANAVAHVGNEGAFAPAKPWAWSGKLIGSGVKAALTKYAPNVVDRLTSAADRYAQWTAARLHIEHGQDTATALAAPVRQGVLDINRVLPDRASQEAAILDLEQIPHALNGAVNALHAAGQHDVATGLVDRVISDPELGFSHAGYELASKVADGSLERENPELYNQIRQAQTLYREHIAAAAGQTTGGAPMSAETRYTTGYGTRGQLSDRALEEREWNVTGTTPRPSAIARIEHAYERARAQGEERLAGAQEKLAKTKAREKLSPEAQAKPGDSLAHDYMEAHRLATRVVDESPSALLSRIMGRDVSVMNVPHHVLVDELRERIFAARNRGDTGDEMGAIVAGGNWRAAGVRVSPRGMEGLRRAGALEGQISALQDIQARAGQRAERSELGAQYARARVPTEEAIRIHGENEAYQAELSRQGMGYKPRLEPAAPPRQLGRREGEEAGAGHVLDTAFRVERGIGRTIEAKTAAGGAAGVRGIGGVARQYREEGGRMERTARAAREVGLAQRHLERLDEQHVRLLRQATEKMTNAPARYRPALIVAKKANGVLGSMADEADRLAPGSGDVIRMAMAELPHTLAEATDKGFNPEFVIGRRPGTERPPGEVQGVSAPHQEPALPSRRRTGEETLRTTASTPTTFAEIGRLQIQRIQAQVQNETARSMQSALGTTPLIELGERQEDGSFKIPDALRIGGPRMDQAMREKGYVAWDPANPFQQVPRGHVKEDTVYIPSQMFRSFARHFGPGGKAEQFFRQWYDRPMRAWKSSVLALTTRWHVSHILGHAILGPVGAGIRPDVLARRMIEAHALLRDHPEQVPAELLSRGLTSAEAMHAVERPPRNLLGRLTQRSYARVGFMDDMQRTAIWLARRETITDRELIDFKRQHPELGDLSPGQLRDQAAIRLSLRAAGDFTHLQPFERQVMRRVFPFYTWLRHITQLAFHLVAHDPLRVAWLLHLSDLYGEPAPFPFMNGMISLGGGHYLRLPKINPFQELSFSPTDWVKNLTPFITVPAALMGRDVQHGTLLGRAPGTYQLDAYGRPKATPQDLGGLLYTLSNETPQTRLARELYESATGGIRERYPSGQEIRVHGQTQYAHPGFLAGAGSAAGSFAGIPQVEKINVAKEQQIVARRLQQNAKSARRYNGPSAAGAPATAKMPRRNPFDFANA